MVLSPPKLSDLRNGAKLIAGLSESTILPDFDFETYSEAGFIWNAKGNKFEGLVGSGGKKGLPVVNAARYTDHPSAEVLCMAYNLKDGHGNKLWRPGLPPPQDLFDYLASGGLIESWNIVFEKWVWKNICEKKYGFPPLPHEQTRCAAAKSRAFALPGSLASAGEVLNIQNKKDKLGVHLINKFCIPRDPTKTNTRVRNPVIGDLEENSLYSYCLKDIEAEAELSSKIPDLNPFELEFWQCDQAINFRGVQIDIESIEACKIILEKAYVRYNQELSELTKGQVNKASEIAKLIKWIREHGIPIPDLNAETVERYISILPPWHITKRALEIRRDIGSAAVKKLYAMSNQVSKGRLHDLFVYHSARTGRAAGTGPQPQNLPNSGIDVSRCSACNSYGAPADTCGHCGNFTSMGKIEEWNVEAVEDALKIIKCGDLGLVEYIFGNSVDLISGCLRGMFIAKEGHTLISSDYSAIEAVVLAALSGEEWRLEVFRTHGKIYEMSASKITGVPFEEFEKYRLETGQHHPMRKKVGKVAELASGYQGWTGAWKAFGADQFFNDQEIKEAVLAWRSASPAIVEMWGGQLRKNSAELFGLEGTVIKAIAQPGQTFSYREISYIVHNDVLFCKLPSGRHLSYHRPRLENSVDRYGLSISYEGWNSNPLKGRIGWTRMKTYGGMLTENVVQAVARDILAHAIVKLEEAGYPVVLHVHDEIVSEVPHEFGSIEDFEKIMSTMPAWAKDWPLVAKGGWRGRRYRK